MSTEEFLKDLFDAVKIITGEYKSEKIGPFTGLLYDGKEMPVRASSLPQQKGVK